MRFEKVYKLLATLFITTSMAQATVTAEFQGIKGNANEASKAFAKKIDTVGFDTVASNDNIQVHYYNRYKEKNIELLSFFTMINKEKIRPLLLKNPDFGAYAPFNMLYFKPLDEDTTWYGHLDADLMLDIIGEKDEATRKEFKEMIAPLDALAKKELAPTTSKKLEFDGKIPDQPLLKMVKKFEGVDDLESFVEEFVSQHDIAFTQHKFIIAGFIDLKFEYEDMELEFDKYDAYWVSSLCHFQFSNSVFNHGEPQAGVYAPCSVYFYIPKGKNEIHMGYATVENWTNTTGITDPKMLDYMKRIADEVIEVFQELGFALEEGTGGESAKASTTKRDMATEIDELKAIVSKLTAEVEALKKKEPVESKAVVPVSKATVPATTEAKAAVKAVELRKKEFTTAKMVIGDIAPKDLTAYYAANPQTLEGLSTKLKANGFEILSTYSPIKDKTVVTVTNSELKASNTYVSVLNILINGEDEIRVQNPSYLGAAYLQDNFKYGQFKVTLTSLQTVLGDMHVVQDTTPFSDLADYNFMFGMPHFGDSIEIAEGDNLAQKLSGDKADKYFAYSIKLPNGSTLVGHKLNKRTNKFLAKIASEHNAGLLPYQTLIKDGKAVMLDPKYYLALSLPQLTMTEFMKIATTPDQIEKDLKRAYQ
ncbi:MAG: hypothetical protein K0U38_11725 [Epsilonproteobacteria bacterium]|nr:hypothetical protein [Campylobacterota bacterium]